MLRQEAEALIAALVKLRESATDEQALAVPALYPAWREGVDYAEGTRVQHEGVLFRVLQAHASMAGWEPSAAPSLFAKVLVADDGTVLAWEQPDSTNGYMIGDKVTHKGIVWVSRADNNVWEPSESVPSLWGVA